MNKHCKVYAWTLSVVLALLMGLSYGMPAHGDAPFPPYISSCIANPQVESGIFMMWLVDRRGTPATDVDMRYRKQGDDAWTDVDITGVEQYQHTIADLDYETTYEVQMRSSNADGTSPWTETKTATTPPKNQAPQITAPLSVEVAENTNDVISVTWNDPDGFDAWGGGGVHHKHLWSATIDNLFVFDGNQLQGIFGFRFRTAPDYENPFPNTGNPNVYTAVLTMNTGRGTRRLDARLNVTVTVTDVDEPPAKPNAPTPTGKTAHTIEVSWDAPINTGRPAITDYDVQYRVGNAAWTDVPHDSAETTATLTGLEGDTVYEFRVRASNDEGTGAWSDAGSVRTELRPRQPIIVTLEPPRTGENLALYLYWTVRLTDATHYEIQYRKTGAQDWLEWEYTTDGKALPGLTFGRFDEADRDELVTGLEGDTVYEFRVRAINANGVSFWSDIKSATPRGANSAPTITSPTDVTIAENTTPLIPVEWADADNDQFRSITFGNNLTYFRNAPGGLQVQEGLNFESPQDQPDAEVEGDAGWDNVYVIYVTVVTGVGAREQTTRERITITVTDVDEPPGTPDAPRVTPHARLLASLRGKWNPPENTGPEITAYTVRYRQTGATEWTTLDRELTKPSVSLRPNDGRIHPMTQYDLQVRATSPEGESDWSDTGTGTSSAVETDVNQDGDSDIHDIIAVAAAIGENARRNPHLDVNKDGTISPLDVEALLISLYSGANGAAPAKLTALLAEAKQHPRPNVDYPRGIAFLELLLESVSVPAQTALLANYPNPFNPETWMPYQLSAAADVTFDIYAVNGTLVRTLSLGHQAAGTYRSKSRAAYWDGQNALGEPVASGIYFYTLTAGNFTATGKMLIRK